MAHLQQPHGVPERASMKYGILIVECNELKRKNTTQVDVWLVLRYKLTLRYCLHTWTSHSSFTKFSFVRGCLSTCMIRPAVSASFTVQEGVASLAHSSLLQKPPATHEPSKGPENKVLAYIISYRSGMYLSPRKQVNLTLQSPQKAIARNTGKIRLVNWLAV